MKKVISFSLWGHDPKYTLGAVRNAELAREIYPGWECWFYVRPEHRGGVAEWPAVLSELARMTNVRVIHVAKAGNWTGMFDRFEAAADPRVDVMISRDCDSRLSRREKVAVDEWLESEEGFHIMRDHPWHGSHILGGMWGVKRGVLPDMRAMINEWNQEDRWQTDQDFLNAIIYPLVCQQAMIHDSFFSMESYARAFPTPRLHAEFVGQIFDENDKTITEHIVALTRVASR